MPRFELKQIQTDLEHDLVWPVYWIYGSERMKSRELVKRIRKAVLGENRNSIFGMAEETIDGSGVDASVVVEAAMSPSLGGGIRLIFVRDAHALKNPEQITELFGPKKSKTELSSVCVFLSKDFDARKKISKQLGEKAAVVACEEVPEKDREAWIKYLAKERGLTLPGESIVHLASIDPWGLDIIDQELEKFSLDPLNQGDSFLGGAIPGIGSSSFLDSFFARNLKQSLLSVETFAQHPDQAIPLVGLFAWNVRHLGLILADRNAGTRIVKLSPYIADKLQAWSRQWTLEEVFELQTCLEGVDFALKQKPLLPVGVWSDLVVRFCR